MHIMHRAFFDSSFVCLSVLKRFHQCGITFFNFLVAQHCMLISWWARVFTLLVVQEVEVVVPAVEPAVHPQVQLLQVKVLWVVLVAIWALAHAVTSAEVVEVQLLQVKQEALVLEEVLEVTEAQAPLRILPGQLQPTLGIKAHTLAVEVEV
jgi:hypothetical protein